MVTTVITVEHVCAMCDEMVTLIVINSQCRVARKEHKWGQGQSVFILKSSGTSTIMARSTDFIFVKVADFKNIGNFFGISWSRHRHI